MPGERVAVVGGGIVGLAVARRLLEVRPGATVVVYEKEDHLGAHQTGRNSGVVHAGVYYAPGSLKARLCTTGRAMLREYCAEKGVTYRAVGKVVVAAAGTEVARLRRIHDNATANGVPGIRWLSPEGLAEVEPDVRGVAALHSPATAITDFVAVAAALAGDVRAAGGDIRMGTPVERIDAGGSGARVVGGGQSSCYATVVVCAGLGLDRIAGRGVRSGEVRIVPFRGEYRRLAPAAAARVRGLVYPVPDPRYPFLGVHLTRRWDGEVLVGPSALLAPALEGYRWSDARPRDLAALAAFPGLWRMGRRHWRTGVRELRLAVSSSAFAREASRYLPGLQPADLWPYPAGIRAQAVRRDGALVDDFAIDELGPLAVVRNAPSPAATSSLAIAEEVVGRLAARPVGT